MMVDALVAGHIGGAVHRTSGCRAGNVRLGQDEDHREIASCLGRPPTPSPPNHRTSCLWGKRETSSVRHGYTVHM